MDNIIKVEGLSKSYSKFGKKKALAVDNVSFEVDKGEVFGFLGPNGAGKTTTLLLMLGFLKPDTGTIKLFGKENDDMGIRAKIGYVPENPAFHKFLTGKELLNFHAELYGIKEQKEKIVSEMLKKIGLEEAKGKKVSTYSRGMLQRLSMGQALLNNPDLLFLDEPTLGLDPIGIVDIRNIILEMREQGKTIFLNSHQLSEVEKVCTRVVFMKQAKIIETYKTSELTESLEDLFIRIIGKEI
ncbi:MAG: ABC transporter ATP-binding protein [bacterium]|nr:ABC transporter ATP-binding protein [bacterium]